MSAPLAGKRIGLLTASASRLGGGVFEAVVAQAQIIRSCGAVPQIFALADAHSEQDRTRFGDTEVAHFDVRGPRQIGYAPALVEALNRAELDCLHLHGIWMYPSRAGALWARATGRGYVISPHGMLDPWITGRGRWKKALARLGYERDGWRVASFMHALTAGEAGDIAQESGRRDSLVIPNAAPEVRGGEASPRAPHIAYIGRIHPKKNLVALVEAWNAADRPIGAQMTIAGWGEPGDVAVLQAAIDRGDGSARFIGPCFGAAKEELLAAARFMVLPSLSEGLPMAVLEGWAAATPSIMTEDCNLPEGFAANAALRCGTTAAEIKAAVTRALALTEAEWSTMAANARALAAGPFSADAVAARWADAYVSAIAQGSTQQR